MRCIQSKVWDNLIFNEILDDFNELENLGWFLLNHSKYYLKPWDLNKIFLITVYFIIFYEMLSSITVEFK